MMLFSESRTTEDISDGELQISGYNLIRCDSLNRHTGGVLAFIRSDINAKVIKMIRNHPNWWCLLLKIKMCDSTWTVGVTYRSPNSSLPDFIDFLTEFCENSIDNRSSFILMGDINCDYLGDSYCTHKIKNCLLSLGLTQMVTVPTRCTPYSSTLIDYVISDRKDIIVKVHDEPVISDHNIVTVNIYKYQMLNIQPQKIRYRDLSDINIGRIKNALSNCIWEFNDQSEAILTNLYVSCEYVVNQVAPIKIKTQQKNSLPWYDYEIKNLARQRDNAYKSFKSCLCVAQRQIFWDNYKRNRNAVVSLLKHKKRLYFENKLEVYKNDVKMLWKTIKEITNASSRESISSVTFNDNGILEILREPSQIPERLNTYFVNSIVSIRNSISSNGSWSDADLPIINCRFEHFKTINITELRKMLTKIKSKFNVDYTLNGKFLKIFFDSIQEPLIKLINVCLQSAKMPNSLKVSTIVPIQKVSNNTEAHNLRPINTLPPVEKLIEICVDTQLREYLEVNNLMMENQSGYRRKHSCETALQLTVASWSESIDQNDYVIAIFLDLKRAFETIDRSLLMEKLRYFGIRDHALKWFENYLNNRKQVTKVGNYVSSEKSVDIGLPQGSVLAPLLFLIYINDIGHFCKCDFINMFADDTLLTVRDKNLTVAVNKMNDVLKEVENYLCLNKLKINVQKTKCMIITTKYRYGQININNINLFLEGERLEIVTEIKYLGVIIDNCLSFSKHSEYIRRKISKKLFCYSRIAKNISLPTRINVYNSIIQPHFDYCSSIIYMFDRESKNMLQILQNRGMRIILECKRDTPVDLMLDTLLWMNVESRITMLVLLFVYKIKNNLLPPYLNRFIRYNNEVHSYFTRNRNNFHIERKNSRRAMKIIFFEGLNQFNALPFEIKEAPSIPIFKRRLITYLRQHKH